MKLEIIQYTLKCKEELDHILEVLDKIKLMLFDNDLDEGYAETYKELESLRLTTMNAIELLNKGFEEFTKEI